MQELPMARAVDSWRIFPFLINIHLFLYKCVIWLHGTSRSQHGTIRLISIVVGAGAAWFDYITGTDQEVKKPNK